MPTVIKCIVHDKKVVDVLRLLKPFALDPPVADPMDDGPINSAKRVTNKGTLTATVFDHVAGLAKAGKKSVTSRELKEVCLANGGQHNSYSYALKLLLNQKKLKRTNHASTYEVMK